MSTRHPFPAVLPPDASPALAIVDRLEDAGCTALLAGGCVRDLLLGRQPHDYDVATDAPPQRVVELFPKSRTVGAQFAVVLVRAKGRWVEVASFRSDGPYLDGRRPSSVTLSDAPQDARRRDFTINGMFLDPRRREIVDYVGGRADLDRRLIRAIGEPATRFEEDFLRLLRAVRFAARLGFSIEPETDAAIRANASSMRHVAAERVRDELERLLGDPSRAAAWRLLRDLGLLDHLWRGAAWGAASFDVVASIFDRLHGEAAFDAPLAIMLHDRPLAELDAAARALACSNEQREGALWLAANFAALDDPAAPSLADFKRLLAHRCWPDLRRIAEVRYDLLGPAGEARRAALAARVDGVPTSQISPPPFVRGDDLIARGVPAGPAYKLLLDELYTMQLDERVATRDDALRALDARLRAGSPPASDS